MITADNFSNSLLSLEYLKQHAFDASCLDLDGNYGDYRVLCDPDTGEETLFTGLTYSLISDSTLYGYTLYVNGARQGQYVRFHLSGKLKIVSNQRNNSSDGTRYEFYESGALRSITIYVSGLCLGGRAYDEDGSVSSEWAESDLVSLLDFMTR